MYTDFQTGNYCLHDIDHLSYKKYAQIIDPIQSQIEIYTLNGLSEQTKALPKISFKKIVLKEEHIIGLGYKTAFDIPSLAIEKIYYKSADLSSGKDQSIIIYINPNFGHDFQQSSRLIDLTYRGNAGFRIFKTLKFEYFDRRLFGEPAQVVKNTLDIDCLHYLQNAYQLVLEEHKKILERTSLLFGKTFDKPTTLSMEELKRSDFFL
ncbi:hypothetical protein QNI19_16380 [Cytophagaceae bacterium DM2B3-1]|uniref:Uncharacterized protein n=1 Tax=Xanthocytophaga flava TaxID=3048013 RepID=A0ABT7CL91_9BACT|nr:hypothetical protein [Xanthocytophaga flavus]MDJ1494523.1 hypothetical protein [Xanthocytophaga flavus]